jgi:hypothetical protein
MHWQDCPINMWVFFSRTIPQCAITWTRAGPTQQLKSLKYPFYTRLRKMMGYEIVKADILKDLHVSHRLINGFTKCHILLPCIQLFCQVLPYSSPCSVITPSVTFDLLHTVSLWVSANSPRVATRIGVGLGREGDTTGVGLQFSLFIFQRRIFKTNYLENPLFKLETIFTFELLFSRSFKLDSMLIGFENFLSFQNYYALRETLKCTCTLYFD